MINERHYISTIRKRLKTWILPILVAILIVVNVVVLNVHAETNAKLSEQQSMTIKAENAHETVSKRLTALSEQKTTIDTSLREERLKTEQLQSENESLKVNLQAKKDAEQAAAQVAVEPTRAAPVAAAITGDKSSWLASSGIPADQWEYVDSIVTRESGWNPSAVNKSSGACGLGQQLPCGKWAGAWNDPVAALTAMNGYATGRYEIGRAHV